MDKFKLLFLFLAIIFPINFVFIILMFSGTVTLNIKGFGFDSEGCLYIGKEKSIEKYLGNSIVDEIYPYTTRDYSFFLQDDIIYLSNIEDVYELDLDGNIIAQYEDAHSNMFVTFQEMNKEVVDSHGRTYKLINILGREYIKSQTGEILYVMPMWQYFFKLLLFLEVMFALFFSVIIVRKYGKGKIYG